MKTYEDLAGASGRRVFYRAERFRARDVFTRLTPSVSIDGVRCTLENLSMSGLAVSSRDGEGAFRGSNDVNVVIEGQNGPLFSAIGRLSRVESRGMDTLFGIKFKSSVLDIRGVVHRHNEALMAKELNGGVSHALDLVPADYRRLCADVVHLVRSYRSTLSRFENLSSRDGETADPERIEAVYAMAEERILPEWRRLWREANEQTLSMMGAPDVLQAVKRFTEQVVTPELVAGPIWNRCYRKPLGYPGDYLMMNYVYEWQPRGATIYEKLLHRLGLDVLECVATRMTMAQKSIAEVVAAGAASGRPARITSLGCGPAQEMVNYLMLRRLPRAVDVTLVDQDHRALDFAYGRIFPEVTRLNDGSAVRCLEVSFIELMKGSGGIVSLPPQDMIYTLGLVDYLGQRRATQLLSALYANLAPGGRLLVGNAAEVPMGGRWSSEFLCDWSMVFRTERDMAELAAAVAGASWDLRADSTGRIHMLYFTRPA